MTSLDSPPKLIDALKAVVTIGFRIVLYSIVFGEPVPSLLLVVSIVVFLVKGRTIGKPIQKWPEAD